MVVRTRVTRIKIKRREFRNKFHRHTNEAKRLLFNHAQDFRNGSAIHSALIHYWGCQLHIRWPAASDCIAGSQNIQIGFYDSNFVCNDKIKRREFRNKFQCNTNEAKRLLFNHVQDFRIGSVIHSALIHYPIPFQFVKLVWCILFSFKIKCSVGVVSWERLRLSLCFHFILFSK